MSEADIWRDGRFDPDPWVTVADDAAVPPDGPVIVSAARLLAAAGDLPEWARLGVVLGPADRLEDLALARVAVVAITFPKFNDGRGFSQARLLGARYGYAGEIRAVGEVLLDQIPLMLRVGITAFQVTHAPTRAALIAGHLPTVPYHYQPASDAPAVAGRRFVGAV